MPKNGPKYAKKWTKVCQKMDLLVYQKNGFVHL